MLIVDNSAAVDTACPSGYYQPAQRPRPPGV